MRPRLFVPYVVGLLVALAVAHTQLDGPARIAAVGGVTLALALLTKLQAQRMIRAYRRDVARLATCDECGYSRSSHLGSRSSCPGGDPGDVFIRSTPTRYGVAR